MIKMTNNYFKLKQKLDNDDLKAVKELEKICLERDKTTLKLELDFKMSLPQDSRHNEVINEFMCYTEDELVGYLGICYFGGDTLEVNGMVHPNHRRKGIFKNLFSLLLDEWDKRDIPKMLLLCDSNSIPGIAFIKTTDAAFRNSEFEMFLKNNPYQKSTSKNVHIRKATHHDAREIAWQDSIYAGVEFREESISMTVEEEGFAMKKYIAEVNDKIIGKVCLQICDGIGGIYGLGVLPEYRGKGYGREILSLAIEKLKQDNPESIMLQVVSNNKTALNLYKSCGFEETSQMDYYEIKK